MTNPPFRYPPFPPAAAAIAGPLTLHPHTLHIDSPRTTATITVAKPTVLGASAVRAHIGLATVHRGWCDGRERGRRRGEWWVGRLVGGWRGGEEWVGREGERVKVLSSTHHFVRQNGSGVLIPGQVSCDIGIRSSCCAASARAGRHCNRRCASTTEAAIGHTRGHAPEGGDCCCACRWTGFGVVHCICGGSQLSCEQLGLRSFWRRRLLMARVYGGWSIHTGRYVSVVSGKITVDSGEELSDG